MAELQQDHAERLRAFAPAERARPGTELWTARIAIPGVGLGLHVSYARYLPGRGAMRKGADAPRPQAIVRAAMASARDDGVEHVFQAAAADLADADFSRDSIRIPGGQALQPDGFAGELRMLRGNLRWEVQLRHSFAAFERGAGRWSVSSFARGEGEVSLGRRVRRFEDAIVSVSHFLPGALPEEAWRLWIPRLQSARNEGRSGRETARARNEAEAVAAGDCSLEALVLPGGLLRPVTVFAAFRAGPQLYIARRARKDRVEGVYPRQELELEAGPYRLRARADLDHLRKTGYLHRGAAGEPLYSVAAESSAAECFVSREGGPELRLFAPDLCQLDFRSARAFRDVMYLDPYL